MHPNYQLYLQYQENVCGIEENLDILLGYHADFPNESGGLAYVIIITYNEATYRIQLSEMNSQFII